MRYLYLLLLLSLGSCSEHGTKELINCNYPGGVILEKTDICGTVYHVQYQGKVYEYVHVYDIDSTYNIGDTINKPCLQ